jgi:hypothetical protein
MPIDDKHPCLFPPAAGNDAVHPTRRHVLQRLATLPLVGALAACGSAGGPDEPGSGPGSGSGGGGGGDGGVRRFAHPGLLHTEADFTRMRAKVDAGAQPWLSGWNALTASSRTNLGTPNPQATIIRGGEGENFRIMVEDMLRAYQGALRWKVSGDTAYADKAVVYLDAWASTMTSLGGNSDRFLAAGIYGYQWANAAEIMRTYPGWSPDGVARFQQWLLDIFYPLSHDFLLNHNGSEITNYWANWDLCQICNILAIGVFCDRVDLYDEAIAYYTSGRGNGAAAHNVYCWHPGHFGQWQESGRDQGHSTLGPALAGPLCEMAWNQGDDLYGHDNNRLLAGAEYVAKSNLTDSSGALYDMPFSVYVNRQGTFTALSDWGRPALRYCWEMLYHHYVNRQGLSAPWVAQMAALLRPEKDAWNGDQPSMGTLTFTRDPVTAGAAPSGLTAHVTDGQVGLSWWGSAYATAYRVERAPAADGPFSPIATVTEPRTWTDAPGDGGWHYRVVALAGAAELVGADVARVVLPTELRLHLPLAEGSGTIAADASGFGRDGTLAAGAGWGAGRLGGSALALDGATGHLALPSGVMAGLSDYTLSVWVHWNSAATHARVLDFGSSDIAYLALMARDGSGRLRCTITGTMWHGEQSVLADSPLPTGRWVHVAITLAGTLGTLYVDGVAVGSNPAISFAPFQLGNTTQNWLGRSQYGADPYFNGLLQDLRLYSGALDASAIAALAI